MSNDLLTTKDAADLLGVSVPTITRLATEEPVQLPTAVKAPGKRGARFFHREDVERLRAEREGVAA